MHVNPTGDASGAFESLKFCFSLFRVDFFCPAKRWRCIGVIIIIIIYLFKFLRPDLILSEGVGLGRGRELADVVGGVMSWGEDFDMC